jgi:hypothetical protein
MAFLCVLVVCTDILFFAGCKQPNDPVTTDTPDQPETDQPTQTTAPDQSDVPDQPDSLDQPDTPGQPDTSDQPDTPDQPDIPAQPDDPGQQDTPNQPDTSDQPDTVVPLEEPAMAELTGAAALHDYLAGLPENTEDTPYRIKVNGINLAVRGTSGNTLRTLYEALSRYVALDLRGCTGDKLINVRTETVPTKAYLVSLTLPDTVITVDKYAFSGCTALTSVNMPQVTQILHGAFSHLPKLTSVYMPNVQVIENNGAAASNGVFYMCTALTLVSMPNLESLGNYAFSDCTALQSITLGPTPPVLGTNVFKDTKIFSAIYVPSAAVTSYKTTSRANWTSDLKEKVQALP